MLKIEKLKLAYVVIDLLRKAAVVVLFAFIVLSMAFQIVLRNLNWTHEILRYVNIWVIFLGAGLAVKHSEHLHMSLLCDKLFGPGRQRLVQIVRLAVVIALLVFVTVAGVEKTISSTLQAQAFPISMKWFYLAIPVGCALMIMDYLLIPIYGRHPFVQSAPQERQGEQKC